MRYVPGGTGGEARCLGELDIDLFWRNCIVNAKVLCSYKLERGHVKEIRKGGQRQGVKVRVISSFPSSTSGFNS